MDIQALEKEFDRVRKRQRTAETSTMEGIDSLIADLQRTERTIAEHEETPLIAQWTQLSTIVSAKAKTITSQHKELQGYIGKAGKAVDKQNTRANIMKHFDADAFRDHADALNKSLAEHLYRQGRFSIAENFVKEAALQMSQEQRQSFMDMFSLLQSLRAHDAGPALSWAQEHRDYLHKCSSPLEFKLHRLRFLALLAERKIVEASAYAKENFPPFAKEHFAAIKTSMGALIAKPGDATSPYASLFSDKPWREAAQLFSQDCCSFLGLSSQSPLAASIEAGCVALPKLLKFCAVLESTASGKHEDLLWSKKESLPVEIDIGKAGQHHTIFTCPVSRDQSTPDNPPMRLPCGHAICMESLKRLAKGGARRKFKCTYCPSEQTLAEATELHF